MVDSSLASVASKFCLRANLLDFQAKEAYTADRSVRPTMVDPHVPVASGVPPCKPG